MGTLFIVIGFALFTAGIVIYLAKHPDQMAHLTNLFYKTQRIVPAESQPAQIQRKSGYFSADQPFTERMASLPAGTMFEVPIGGGRKGKLQVGTVLKFNERKQFRTKEWERSGTVWYGLLCRGNPATFPGEVLVAQLGPDGYLLTERVLLGPDDASAFQQYGKEFVAEGKTPGKTKLLWDGSSYGIRDIGVFDVESLDGDSPHIPEGVIARFIRAHNDDGPAVLIEDAKSGYDSVWVGQHVNLNRVVTDVLTSTGE